MQHPLLHKCWLSAVMCSMAVVLQHRWVAAVEQLEPCLPAAYKVLWESSALHSSCSAELAHSTPRQAANTCLFSQVPSKASSTWCC